MMHRVLVVAVLIWMQGIALGQSPYPRSPLIRTVTFDWATHRRDAQGSDN
jgi:hypothetical protein